MSSGTCNWVEHVAPYSLGELGAGEEAFERHLKACAICQ